MCLLGKKYNLQEEMKEVMKEVMKEERREEEQEGIEMEGVVVPAGKKA